MIGSPTFNGTHPEIASPRIDESRPAPADHPGRWVGGVVGALASLVAAGVIAVVSGDANPARNAAVLVALLGIPIGFGLGRQLLPLARSGGWGTALWVGVLFGWIAPPIGAIEILLGPALLVRTPAEAGLGTAGWLGLVILVPYALVFSFVAIVITIPVGVAWALLLKVVPDDALARLRAPRQMARFGVRHLILALVLWLILVQVGVVPALLPQPVSP